MKNHQPQIIRVVFLMVCVTLVYMEVCNNCPSGCDAETDKCSGDCADGWDGPTCSRGNVALDKSTWQTTTFSGYQSRLAVDGGTEHNLLKKPYTCTQTRENKKLAYWTVTLGAQYNIYRFRIYNRNGFCTHGPCEDGQHYDERKPAGAQGKPRSSAGGNRLNGFSLSVRNTSKNYRLCYHDTTTNNAGPGNVIDGDCGTGGPILGNKVKIMINNTEPLTLCEVQIFVCANGTYGGDCGKRCGKCALGPSNCDTISGYCPRGKTRCMPGYSPPKCDTECTNNTWGADCLQSCGQCYNNIQCNRTTGDCPVQEGNPLCNLGYSGSDCMAECSNNMWGDSCSQHCGQCSNRVQCNPETGECPMEEGSPRCKPGYSGSNCTAQCSHHTWGADCSGICGQCYNNTQCNAINGQCPVKEGNPQCDPGYFDSDCREIITSEVKAPPGSGVNPAYVGGGVAAAVALVLIVVVVVIITLRRRRRQPFKNDVHEPAEQIEGSIFHSAERQPEENRGFQEGREDLEEEPQCDLNPYVNADILPTLVSVGDFLDYVTRRKVADGFDKEFEKFPVGLHAKHEAANKPENKEKSRYRSLVAYDHSRVLLSVTDDKKTDYINACYINGYNEPKKYIASQGPNDVILNDFVRMIWEQKSGKVVMVTNLKETTKTKCCQYWPDEGARDFGLVTMTLLEEEFYADFTVRTLQLTHSKTKTESYTVKQFHFTAWPDHGAPAHATTLLEFRDKVNGYQTPMSGPIVVHCSAGVGRTGTYIALDYLLNQAREEGVLNVPACVRQLREQRVNMVQALEQYIFLHEALAEALELRSSCVPWEAFPRVLAELCTPDPETNMTKMAEQFQSLQRLTSPLDEDVLTSARHPDNVMKNRSSRILAADTCRLYLSTPVPDGNNYINAVYLPAFKSQRGFIITQTPLPNTVLDFWRLVYDHGLSAIVMIDSLRPRETDVGIYWPSEGVQFDPFVVEVKNKQEHKGFAVWTYHLTHKDTVWTKKLPGFDHLPEFVIVVSAGNSHKATHPIQQFRCKFWSGAPHSSSIPSLLAVIEEATKWQQKTGNRPVLVHCRDGVTKCGVYCAAACVVERLKADKEVNIVHTVKQMRANRPELITDLDQFHFLHQVANGYLETAHTYANMV